MPIHPRPLLIARSAVFGSVLFGSATPAVAQDAGSAARRNEHTLGPSSSESPGESGARASALDHLRLALFVDAYAAWQTSGPGTLATLSGHRTFSGQGANLRVENGLSLAFLGLDAVYDTGRFGAVANLRFGQAASIYQFRPEAESDARFGVDHLTQAYILYRPWAQLELDLGMFASPFGAEALESWKNQNYTIGALYHYGQPSWHMGLKARWQLAGRVSITGLVVNGSNNISEAQQNAGLSQLPTLGASVDYALTDALSFAVGGLAAMDGEHNEDNGYDVFADLVSALKLGAFTGYLNLNYILTRNGAPSGAPRHFWGGSLIAGQRFQRHFGVALRGEYLRDDANYAGSDVWKLFTGTLTLHFEPIPSAPNFTVRWENRWEKSNQSVFGQDSRGTLDTEDDSYSSSWFESVIGVVVTTPGA